MSGSNPIELAAGVVAAFVSNNSVPVGELPALIQAVHASVKKLAEEQKALRRRSRRRLQRFRSVSQLHRSI